MFSPASNDWRNPRRLRAERRVSRRAVSTSPAVDVTGGGASGTGVGSTFGLFMGGLEQTFDARDWKLTGTGIIDPPPRQLRDGRRSQYAQLVQISRAGCKPYQRHRRLQLGDQDAFRRDIHHPAHGRVDVNGSPEILFVPAAQVFRFLQKSHRMMTRARSCSSGVTGARRNPMRAVFGPPAARRLSTSRADTPVSIPRA